MYFQDGGRPLDGPNFPCQWHNYSFGCNWDISISRLRGFGWKMRIRANFRQFWGTLTHKIMMSLIWPPPCSSRVLRYCSLKSFQRCLFEKHYVNKRNKVIGRTPNGYISPVWWGEAHSNPIVNICGLWVSLPDVINCNKFHISCASFRVAGPRKLGVPIDLRGDLYKGRWKGGTSGNCRSGKYRGDKVWKAAKTENSKIPGV